MTDFSIFFFGLAVGACVSYYTVTEQLRRAKVRRMLEDAFREAGFNVSSN